MINSKFFYIAYKVLPDLTCVLFLILSSLLSFSAPAKRVLSDPWTHHVLPTWDSKNAISLAWDSVPQTPMSLKHRPHNFLSESHWLILQLFSSETTSLNISIVTLFSSNFRLCFAYVCSCNSLFLHYHIRLYCSPTILETLYSQWLLIVFNYVISSI